MTLTLSSSTDLFYILLQEYMAHFLVPFILFPKRIQRNSYVYSSYTLIFSG
jgi:hypothetical protein